MLAPGLAELLSLRSVSWRSNLIYSLISVVLGLFSIPKIYELYQPQIDEYVGLAKQNVDKVNQIVQEKLPFLKHAEKKAEKAE